MADTIDIPGVGPTKSTYVYAGGALVAGIAGYAWWQYSRNRQPTDFVGASPDDFGVTDYDSPLGSSGTNSTGNFSQLDPDAIDTNAKWTIDAADKLSDRGYDSGTVIAALGKYLQRKGLTEDEIAIVQAAIAVSGPPPVGGPYPITAALPPPPSTGGGTTNPPPSDTTIGKVTGLTYINIWTFAIELHYKSVSGATGYEIFVDGASYDTVGKVTGVMLRRNIQPGKNYSVTVRAKKGSDFGPMSDAVTIHVPTASEGGHTS